MWHHAVWQRCHRVDCEECDWSARRDFGPGVRSVVRAEAPSAEGPIVAQLCSSQRFSSTIFPSLSEPPLTLGQVQSRIPAGYAYIDVPEGDARDGRAEHWWCEFPEVPRMVDGTVAGEPLVVVSRAVPRWRSLVHSRRPAARRGWLGQMKWGYSPRWTTILTREELGELNRVGVLPS